MSFCPECGNKTNTNDKFCGKCGKSLKEQRSNASVTTAPTINPTQKQVKYEGTVHKCPFCGEIVDSLKANCPSCGKEFRDTSSALTVKEFSERLIEISKNPPKNRKVTASDPILPVDRMKIELIQGFPIPNSKEDIIEFLVLANSNIVIDAYSEKATVSQREVANAWLSKYEQSVQKAKIVLRDCPEIKIIEEEYNKKKAEIADAKSKAKINVLVGFLVVFGVLFGWLLIMLFAAHFFN